MRAISDAEKELRGTWRKPRSQPASGTAPRLMAAIPPPRDLSPAVRAQWKTHMAMIIASGRMSTVDLFVFAQLAQTAVALDVVQKHAERDGPHEIGQHGEPKAGVAWRMWLQTQERYVSLLREFGLTPKARGAVPQLAAPAPELHVIEGRR